jgi:transposase
VFDPVKAVVFDFAESRAGRHVQTFFGQDTDGGWRGTLICDDYAGDVAAEDMWRPPANLDAFP